MTHDLSFVARLSQCGTRLKTRLFGAWVGRDRFGNTYYQAKSLCPMALHDRWVLFAGEVEASRLPPVWRSWLQHRIDAPELFDDMNSLLPSPLENGYVWQKPHLPNLTGSDVSCLPFGHGLRKITGRTHRLLTRETWAWIPPEE